MRPDWKLEQTTHIFDRIRNDPENRVPEQKIVILIVFGVIILSAEALTSLVRQALRKAVLPDGGGSETTKLLLFLYTTVISTVLVLFSVRLLERRSFRSMGLTRQKLLPDYAAGTGLGFLMMAGALLLQLACGALRNEGTVPQKPGLAAFLLIGGWILQGFNEEVIFRGWLMISLGTRAKTWTAIMFSSVIFMTAHLGNNGISLMAVLNLTLFGIVTSLLILRTDSIWAAAAMHSAWNWAQGNFFGCNVSGIDSGISVLKFTETGAPEIISGGAFGPEGSILTTAILLPVILFLLACRTRGHSAENCRQA